MTSLKTSLLLLCFFASPFAQASELIQDTIYNGTPVASTGQAWKSTVSLSFQSSDRPGHAACSGVFIDEDLILTAAHCRIKNRATLSIRLFKENSTEPTEIVLSEKEYVFHPHPAYQKVNAYDPGTDDVAIIVLRTERLPFDAGFEPAELHHSKIRSAADIGNAAIAVGTGLTEKNEMSDHLYYAQGAISAYENGSVVRVLFANSQGICGGDSGGPIFVKHEGKLYLSALTSATVANINEHCGNTLFGNVITADRYNWIQAKAKVVRALL